MEVSYRIVAEDAIGNDHSVGCAGQPTASAPSRVAGDVALANAEGSYSSRPRTAVFGANAAAFVGRGVSVDGALADGRAAGTYVDTTSTVIRGIAGDRTAG